MPRRILEGEVVSDKMSKTITVLVERRYIHPVYKKYVKRTDKYAAHDENNAFAVGDRVQIVECRPISRKKRWTVYSGDGAPQPSGKARAAQPETDTKESNKKPTKKTGKKAAAKKKG
jgi:small subunit ribosomal protein S17